MQYLNPDIESSYRQNDLGRTLYDLVVTLKPKKILEFGVLNAYSTVCMAMALHELGRGKIQAYDLWGSYKFKHGEKHECMWEVMKRGLGKHIQFIEGDFWFTDIPRDCDMICLDISNDGNIIKKAVKKLRDGGFKGIIVFEGGSPERDSVEWMKKYKRLPIAQSGVKYKIINHKFPSISIT